MPWNLAELVGQDGILRAHHIIHIFFLSLK